jgi:hypothetical protein
LSSYKIFNITYSEKEIKVINNFKINNELSFVYYGKFNDNSLNSNLLIFLQKIGNNDKCEINIIKNIILKLIKKIIRGYNNEFILLNIRIILPNQDFIIPRWHIDNYNKQFKFICVLKGPCTLFINEYDNENRKKFIEINNKMLIDLTNCKYDLQNIYNIYRRKISDELKEAQILQPNNNQGVIFLADYENIKNSAIHSEPNENTERFFISIICNDQENIEKMKELFER